MSARKTQTVFPCLLSIAALLPPAAALAGDAEVELRHGIYAYEHADYAEAVAAISSVLYPLKLTSEEDVASARKYLGAAFFFSGKKAEAAEEFKKLLILRPEFKMDAFMFPPPLVLFFDEVRASIKDRLETAKPGAEQQEGIVRQSERIIERRAEKHSFALNFVPFGAPQFQNGHMAKGWALFGIEVALLALNIASYWQARSYAGPDGYYRTESARDGARNWMIIQMTSLSLLGGAVVYGIADGIVYFKPQVETVSVKVTEAPVERK
jgi:hypothetical protein